MGDFKTFLISRMESFGFSGERLDDGYDYFTKDFSEYRASIAITTARADRKDIWIDHPREDERVKVFIGNLDNRIVFQVECNLRDILSNDFNVRDKDRPPR